jgi:hypothetical protein
LLKDFWSSEAGSASLYSPERTAAPPAQPQTRMSNGLDQFFSSIQDRENLSILDFAGASQANVSFITSLGHRIYSNDIMHTFDDAFGGGGDIVANQADPGRAEFFLHESLHFPDQTFDGVLVWDTLQFLAPPLLQETVDRLHRILRPQSALLAFFNSDEKVPAVATYNYRIAESKVLSLTPRGPRTRAQYFNNRSLEKLFQKFHSVKFFLTRDSLREVIVRR